MDQEQNTSREKPRKSIAKPLAITFAALAGAIVFFFIGFFVYYLTLPEGVRSLLWMKDQIDDYYYQDVSDEDYWNAALGGISSVLDDYSQYYDADSYDAVVDDLGGKMSGFGTLFFASTNKLYKVAIGSPVFYAERVQGNEPVQAGMFLTGVGTSPTEMKDIFYVQSGGGYAYNVSVGDALAGYGAGETVYMRFSKTAGNDTQNCVVVKVTPGEYTESYVLYAAGGKAYAALYGQEGGNWSDVSAYVTVQDLVPSGAAYLRIVEFSGAVVSEFRAAAQQYRSDGATRLLIDLRNNGGGLVDAMVDLSAMLMKDGKDGDVVQTQVYKDGTQVRVNADTMYYNDYFAGSTVSVAANANTASASEALIGSMISYNTIGYDDIFLTATGGMTSARTYGKGIMQGYFVNSVTGECAKLTVATVHWANGRCIHGTGISTADGARLSPAETFADYGDPELQNIFASMA